MANTINVSLKIDDNGTIALTTRSANKLKKELDAIGASANQASKSMQNALARSDLTGGKSENIAYRNARGVAGTGGGDSRDFAKQAQGLGGLVHVYATFAANIFAVGAAFTALSKAQANANMEAASMQLSNTLGLNVKEVAKDVQSLTGYALSLQDSIKAVNVGLQSGISSKNLKELVVIAKGAANVMGRDVSDSIDRVIRGTAKQEQEILDELGIIIRSKQAWDEYAKSIGKAGAEALTAAEKQEGYTLAVIKAGQKQKEFANSFTNPYDKLLASVTEVGNTLLSGINKFFAPIAGFLADTQSALYAIIGGITTFLLTKAIPTLRIVGDNLAAEREKNLTYAKKLVEAYSSQSSVFNKQEQENIRQQLDISKKNISKYGDDVKNTFDSISKVASKANIDLKNSLKLDPTAAAADIDKLSAQLNRSIRGLSAAATSTRAGTGINKNLAEETRISKAVELEKRRNDLMTYRDALLKGEESQLAKINAELEKQNALEQRSNALIAEGGMLNEKAQAAIDAINAKRDLRLNTLNQSQAFADILNNPIASLSEKTKTFWEGFKAAGKTSVVGEEGPLQPSKVGALSKGMEKLTYSFQALSFVGEALIGILGKVFMWFTIITTVWSGVEWILEKTGLWTDKTEKLNKASESLNEVLNTQNKYLATHKELLNATDLDLTSYITKYNSLSESFSQSADKLRELKKAQDELNAGGGLNKWYQSISGGEFEQAQKIKQTLEQRLKDSGVSAESKAEIQLYLEREKRATKWNGLLSEGLPLLIKVDEATSNLALKNRTLLKSFEGLGDGANEAFSKIFDKKEHTGFASELGQTLDSQLIKPLDNLVERYKSGAISQEAFRDGIHSFRGEMDKVGPGIREALPAFNDYLKALVLVDTILNKIKNAKPGEDLSASMKQAAAEAKRALDSPELKAALSNLTAKSELLKQQEKALQVPKEPQKTGLSLADKATAKSMADNIRTINTEIKTLDASIKDTSATNSRIAAIRGYSTEAELANLAEIERAKSLKELDKSKAEAELEYFKIVKDVGSTKEAKDNAAQNRLTKLNEASLQYSLNIKGINDQYNSSAIDSYIKKNNLLLDTFDKQIDSAQSIYDNLEKLNKVSAVDKINIDATIRQVRLAEKLKTDLDNLDKQYFSAGSQIPYEVYADKRNKLQNEYNDRLRESIDLTNTQTLLENNTKAQVYLNNKISAIQSVIDIEAEFGKVSINNIKERMVAEEELYKKRVEEAGVDVEKLRNLQIEKANRLYKEQLELLEARKKNFIELSLSEQLGTISDEAYRQAASFSKNLKDTVTGTFDAIYSGMDAAIDELTTKMMKSEKISLKDLVLTFRNTAAEEFRKMSADLMKKSFRDFAAKGIEIITGKPSELRTVEEQQLSVLQQIANNTSVMAGGQSIASGNMGTGYSTGYSEAPDITDMTIEEATKANEGYYGAMQEATDAADVLAAKTPSLFENIGNSFNGLLGKDGLLLNLLGKLGGSIGSIFQPILSLFGLGGGAGDLISGGGFGGGLGGLGGLGSLFSGGDIGSAIGSALGMEGFGGWLSGLFFANGGIMTDKGALSLNKYSTGGIANRPQLAMYGEGRQPEAYVPLPDGKTIPVTMQGGSGSGNVTVSINITDNSTTSDTTASGGAKDYAAMAKIISSKVKEELINQKRPGGILY